MVFCASDKGATMPTNFRRLKLKKKKSKLFTDMENVVKFETEIALKYDTQL